MLVDEFFSSLRRFELWSYVVSYRQLLLRSTKSTDFPTRMGILFKDASLMLIETSFDGLSIQELDRDAPELPIDVSRIPSGHKLFRLTASAGLGYIAAAGFISTEDEKEYYDGSALISSEHLGPLSGSP
jgi:hypothetical protein